MLTVYRAELPRTLTLVVARSLAVPAASLVVREFHSTDSQITIMANLDRKPFEATMTTVCGKCRRELAIGNSIDRMGSVE
jgi:hypothetical protein